MGMKHTLMLEAVSINVSNSRHHLPMVAAMLLTLQQAQQQQQETLLQAKRSCHPSHLA
jgi:hypothetical protein